MNIVTIFRNLGPVDIKNVQRDQLLVWVPLLPLFLAVIIRVAIPPLADWLAANADFDLTVYFPLIMSAYLLTTPSVAGMIVGFLLLDERDDRTLTALLVTPLPVGGYLAYRIIAPVVLGFAVTLIGYPIAGLAQTPLPDLLAITALGALYAPVVALFLAGFAENKVAGFALVKFINTFVMIPVIAYFVQSDLQLLAGIVPPYWAMKAFWTSASGGSILPYLLAGVAVNGLVIALLLRRFRTVLYR